MRDVLLVACISVLVASYVVVLLTLIRQAAMCNFDCKACGRGKLRLNNIVVDKLTRVEKKIYVCSNCNKEKVVSHVL
jgi:hypothetical protein